MHLQIQILLYMMVLLIFNYFIQLHLQQFINFNDYVLINLINILMLIMDLFLIRNLL